MKKRLLFLIVPAIFTSESYASFSVTENTQTELVCENTEAPTFGNK